MKTSTFLTDLGCTADVDRSLFEETKIEAEKGDADAQNNLGFAYANGEGVVKNEAEAVKWYRKAADQGDADAQFNLGKMYAAGRGVVKDEVEAYKWFLLSGAQGTDPAKKGIEIMERVLTPQQRAEGQKIAREWKSRKP